MDIKINSVKINWNNSESYFFTHPQKKKSFDLKFLNALGLQGHLFIMTSGSTEQKCVALSKKACLISAQAVNQHLQVTSKDRWLICLPLFHIGGISILARCYLSQSLYFIENKKWDPFLFVSQLKQHQVTLTSLVPTQVYDLVQTSQKPPPYLRAIVVGGGYLSENLYLKGRSLGWPLLPSYGLTEAGSQVATADLNSLKESLYPNLKILNHCKVQIQNNRIAIQSSSLLTGWISQKAQWNQVKEWLLTEDYGSLKHPYLKVEGRKRYVKIRGEGVSLNELENILMQVKMELKAPGRYVILATPHPRVGHQIDLVSADSHLNNLLEVRDRFNQQVLGHERIQNCYFVSSLPQGSLSKIQFNVLNKQLGLNVEE